MAEKIGVVCIANGKQHTHYNDDGSWTKKAKYPTEGELSSKDCRHRPKCKVWFINCEAQQKSWDWTDCPGM